MDLQTQLNGVSPNVLADALRLLGFGDLVRSLPTTKMNMLPVAAPGEHAATLQRLPKSSASPVVSVGLVYARAGTGTLGPLTAAAYPPAAGQYSLAPNGDIVVLAADAYTVVDAVWVPAACKLVEVPALPVAANVLTLPLAVRNAGVLFLVSTTAEVAGAGGLKIVLAPGAAAPAATQARLNLAKTTVTFAGADAVTSASCVVAVKADADIDALLSALTTLTLYFV